MIKISIRKISIYLSLFLIISAETMSQTSYILNPENSKMTILGTSTLHDWQMEVKDIDCSMALITEGENIRGIQDTWFSCITSSIVSDYNIMDKKTHEALKAEKFSNIIFRMINGKVFFHFLSMTENEFKGTATGFLSLAGQTKEIKVPFHGNLLENGQVKVEGKVDLKMSEFKVDPPTAMLGTLKTGDEISIIYSLELQKTMINKQISEVKAVSGTGN
jgi:hypothetical protein